MIWRLAAAVATLIALALAGPAIRHYRERPADPPALVRGSFPPPAGVEFGGAERGFDAAFTADGTRVAFVGTRDGQSALWQRLLSDERAELLPGTGGAAMPAWKPGNRVVAFFAGGKLKQIALGDDRARDLADAPRPSGAAWDRDGSLLFAPDGAGPIKRLRNGTAADETTLAAGDLAHAFPAVADDGALLYVALRADGGRVLRYRRAGDQRDLGPTASHAEIVGSVVVYVRNGVLFAQRLDAAQRAFSGRAVPLAASAGVSAAGRGLFAASPRVIAVAPLTPITRTLHWYDARGVRGAPLIEPGPYWQARLSPDDRQLALTGADPLLRTLDVFTVALRAPTDRSRISLSLGADSDPVFTSDGRRVIFRSQQQGAAGLLARAIGSQTAEQVILASEGTEVPTDVRDHLLMFHAPSPSTALDIWTLNLTSGERRQVTTGAFNERDARWSPDGRLLAFTSDESGTPEIYVDAWPRDGRRVRVTFAGGKNPQWSSDGRALYFVRGNEILRAAFRPDYRSSGSPDGIAFGAPEAVLVADTLIDFTLEHRGNRLGILSGAPSAMADVAGVINWIGSVPPIPEP